VTSLAAGDRLLEIGCATGKPIKVGGFPLRDRDHPGRQDRIREQRRLGHGDADHGRHEHPGPPITVGSCPQKIVIVP